MSGATRPLLDRERFHGALLGLAVGDALGTTLEFRPPGTFAPVTEITGGGPFGLPAGAWTDDTSMALCLAESLIASRRFDPVDQLQRYLRWYREGHLSSTGHCFEIGNATRAALERFDRTGDPYPGDAAPDAAGNGPLMKLAPIALAYAHRPGEAARLAGLSARTTHGDPRGIDAARHFADLLVRALRGAGRAAVLGHPGAEELDPEVAAVAAGSFARKAPPAIRGTGFVVDALEAALWALHATESFEDGVLAAVNLGDDADTTGAIFGQLAGALYGASAIPERWREKVVMQGTIVALADGLFDLAEELRVRPPHDSYWVIPGRVLAGPYPGDRSPALARAKVDDFVAAGVTVFVDLTEDGELDPYVARCSSARQVRHPIVDVDVPTVEEMHAILATIRAATDAGEVVYVHCWGGVGRTGTVVGCLLREEGLDADAAIAQIGELRADTQRVGRPSPETPAQRQFVERWAPSHEPTE